MSAVMGSLEKELKVLSGQRGQHVQRPCGGVLREEHGSQPGWSGVSQAGE